MLGTKIIYKLLTWIGGKYLKFLSAMGQHLKAAQKPRFFLICRAIMQAKSKPMSWMDARITPASASDTACDLMKSPNACTHPDLYSEVVSTLQVNSSR